MSIETALAGAPTPQNSSASFAGKWKNQLKSRMTLEVQGQSVSGSYVSMVRVDGKEKEIGGRLVGFVDGDMISFVVNWDGAGALTAWVGQLVGQGAKEELKTLWHLALDAPDGKDEDKLLWRAVWTGADIFKRAS